MAVSSPALLLALWFCSSLVLVASAQQKDCSQAPALCNPQKTGCVNSDWTGPTCNQFKGDISASDAPQILVRVTHNAPLPGLTDRNAASLNGDYRFWDLIGTGFVAYHLVCMIQSYGPYEFCSVGKCTNNRNPPTTGAPMVGRQNVEWAGYTPNDFWYSFPSVAMCGDSSNFGHGCSWHEVGMLKVVNVSCAIRVHDGMTILKSDEASGGCDDISSTINIPVISLDDIDSYHCAAQASSSSSAPLAFGRFSLLSLAVVVAAVGAACLGFLLWALKARPQHGLEGGYVAMPNASV